MKLGGDIELTLDEFLNYMDSGKEVIAGSPVYVCAFWGGDSTDHGTKW